MKGRAPKLPPIPRDHVYGNVTMAMAEAIAEEVRGKRVWDLGCGSGDYTVMLGQMGAAAVEGVDRDPVAWVRTSRGRAPLPANVQIASQTWIHAWTPAFPAEVAYLSWPVNWSIAGLVDCLRRVPRVLYVGSNVRDACGGRDLWAHLFARRVERVIEGDRELTERWNDLIVYGPVEIEEREGRAPDPADWLARRGGAPPREELAYLHAYDVSWARNL